MKMHHQVADRAPRWDDADERGAPIAWPAPPNSLQDIVDLAAKFTGASGAALALEKSSGEIVCAARSGETAPAVGAVLNRSIGISAVCVRANAVQRCADTEVDPRVDAQLCRQLGIRSILVLPVRRNGRVAGLLSVYSRHASKFDHRDVAGLKYLQSVAAGLADAEEAKAQLAPELVADRLPRQEPSIDVAKPETALPPKIGATVSEFPRPAKAGAELESPLGDRVAPASKPGAEELAGWLRPQRPVAPLRTLIIALGMIAIAALALAGLRFTKTHSSSFHAQLPPPVVMSETPQRTPSPASESLPAVTPLSVAENPVTAETAPVTETGVRHVQSIESSLGSGYARVTIGLDRSVKFTAFRLERPERVYFDLRNTRFAPGVRPQTIAVAGPALRGIRSSQYAQDVVRVVLDLDTRAAYRVEFQADPPRLVIAVDSGRKQPLRTADKPAAPPRASVGAGAVPAPKSW
jgi:putative methionine-R-sulfoxide reductase with GAF domain